MYTCISGNGNPKKASCFLYFWKWNFSVQAQKAKNIHPRKFHTLQKMELFDFKIKKFIIFSQNKAFLIFWEMKTSKKFLIF